MLDGNALPQIEPPFEGIHLFWMGPLSWIYSPEGWYIQRRKFSPRHELRCETLSRQIIAGLRDEKELRLPFGWLTYRSGFWGSSPTTDVLTGTAAEIFRLELDNPVDFVQVNITAKFAFSFALYQGKVVAKVEPPAKNNVISKFYASAIDTVVTYALSPVSLTYCVPIPEASQGQSWDQVPYLVKALQLPLRELNPALLNFEDELKEAQSRLLPGETIDVDAFQDLLDKLRPMVTSPDPPRPIDKVLLLREDPDARFEELNSTALPLSLLTHPKWRRVLGFSWFDQDSALVAGETYEYRITGFFPAEDLEDRIYGFHTIPSSAALPAVFFLHDIMLRIPQPGGVELAPGTSQSGQQQQSRRGLQLKPKNQFFWLWPSLEEWSLVIDFSVPVEHIKLELQEGHELKYEGRMNGIAIGGADTVPPGTMASLIFASPVNQLRLTGTGFLFTIRVVSGSSGIQPFSHILPPVHFVNYHRPQPPEELLTENLQKITSRSALGFELSWPPSLQNGLLYWPPGELAPPPLDSTLYQIEHREIPDPDWSPLLPDENWILGHRRSSQKKAQIRQGVDLMRLFPERPTPDDSTNQEMIWNDVFDFSVDGNTPLRPVPQLGTSHQYRIRAIDVIGRPSSSWTESDPIDLQKHAPPPVPVNVQIRTLVKDAPDLTDTEMEALGTDDNLILLRWEWHEEQRNLDPHATEFRLYLHQQALDAINGNLTTVNDLGNGQFEVVLELEDNIVSNILQDTFLVLDNYPFYVESHEGGDIIKMILSRRIPDGNDLLTGPTTGPVTLPVLVGSERMRAPAWSVRIGVKLITTATKYEFEIRNQLQLSPSQIRDELWVGVSTADKQPYIDDPLSPEDDRPGNESPIVPLRVQARYWGRPDFDIPPPLELVPQLRTPEPEEGPVSFELDITSYFDTPDLIGLQQMRLERTSVGTVFSQYYASTANSVMARGIEAGQVDVEVPVPNPEDKLQILAALQQPTSSQLADQHAIYLAGAHPYRAAFFVPLTPDPVAVGPILETLQPFSTRYIYRIRGGNTAGLISEGDAVAKVVVRVPSLKPGARPERIFPPTNGAIGMLQLRHPADEEVTHQLYFYEEAFDGPGPQQESALLRIANRPDLYPNKVVRLRTASGNFLEGVVTDLSGPEIVQEASSHKLVAISINEAPGTTWRVWACSLTRDGIPSELAGPWRITMPIPP